MRDPRIIIPGALPPQENKGEAKFGAVQFGVNADNTVRFEPVYAKRGQAAKDILCGNPDFCPFLVAVPFITSRLTIDPDLKHDVVFIRGKAHTRADCVGTALGAVKWWDERVGPRFHGPAAESGGAPVAQVLDEGDAAEVWKDACRLYKKDPAKHPMVAIGDPEVPFFFCMPGEVFACKHLQRFTHFNHGVRGHGRIL